MEGSPFSQTDPMTDFATVPNCSPHLVKSLHHPLRCCRCRSQHSAGKICSATPSSTPSAFLQATSVTDHCQMVHVLRSHCGGLLYRLLSAHVNYWHAFLVHGPCRSLRSWLFAEWRSRRRRVVKAVLIRFINSSTSSSSETSNRVVFITGDLQAERVSASHLSLSR